VLDHDVNRIPADEEMEAAIFSELLNGQAGRTDTFKCGYTLPLYQQLMFWNVPFQSAEEKSTRANCTQR
jgi:hypothetical protein